MKQSAVRARIRQICSLGLPGEMLMASLLPALRELVPSDSAGFFWVNPRGDLRNFYVERLLEPEVMALYFERFYEGRNLSFRRAFLERARAPDGVVATSAGEKARKSPDYEDMLARLNAHHVLYGIVREQGTPLGQLSLYRPVDARPFSARDLSELSSVMRYVAQGVSARKAGDEVPHPVAFEEADEEAILVTDGDGVLRHATGNGKRLLFLATTSEFTPAALRAAVGERARAALRALCKKLRAIARDGEAQPPVLALESCWGRFVLRAHWLDDDGAGELVGVRIQRHEPMILRFVQAMARLALSSQQREIALMIAQGRSNQEIADGLGISGNTVAYHVKQLFLKLDVHDRADAVAKIASGEAAARA